MQKTLKVFCRRDIRNPRLELKFAFFSYEISKVE